MIKLHLLCIVFIAATAHSQNIGIGTTSPNSSAILDINAVDKGLLIPRLDTAQINAIPNPANGLVVYCTTFGKPVFKNGPDWYFFDGSRMKPFFVGEQYGGGIVFYVDRSGRHGLIASPTNLSSAKPWGCSGMLIANSSPVLGAGPSNTASVSMNCSDSSTAAISCELSNIDGYDDWFLPSKDELNIIGGFISYYYWSSTEISGSDAWYQNFADGLQFSTDKASYLLVRPVRRF
jgi:hypothetical protein